MTKYLLEIAVFDYWSAVKAAKAGADRLEICANHHEGGTTPTYGTLQQLARKLHVPMFVMVRPRGGDFCYDAEELSIMKADLQTIKNIGFQGVVLGFLNKDGSIDKINTSRFVAWAYPMEVTFHRAFDRAKDPGEALEDIIDCGCQRILTSGQRPHAIDALATIKSLITQADDRITIMPGSGVRSHNIKLLAEETNAVEFHSAASKRVASAMDYINPAMLEDNSTLSVDEDEIELMKKILHEMN